MYCLLVPMWIETVIVYEATHIHWVTRFCTGLVVILVSHSETSQLEWCRLLNWTVGVCQNRRCGGYRHGWCIDWLVHRHNLWICDLRYMFWLRGLRDWSSYSSLYGIGGAILFKVIAFTSIASWCFATLCLLFPEHFVWLVRVAAVWESWWWLVPVVDQVF